jgi:hypothetical protein
LQKESRRSKKQEAGSAKMSHPTDLNILKVKKALQQLQVSSNAEARYTAIEEMYPFCEDDNMKEVLCYDKDLGFLAALKQFLENFREENDVVYLVVCLLVNLSVGGKILCILAIASEELALLPLLSKMLSTSSSHIADQLERVMTNCSYFSETHRYLFSSEVCWLQHLTKVLMKRPNDMIPYWYFNNFMINMSNEHVRLVVESEASVFILEKILPFGSDTTKWGSSNIANHTTWFVLYMSISANGSNYLRDYFTRFPQYCTFFLDLLSSPTIHGMKATIAIANIYGKEENHPTTKALLQTYPNILPFLLEITDAIMNYDKNRPEIQILLKKGFRYGNVNLSILAIALRNLSISDENKTIMNQNPKLLEFVGLAIKLFIDNAPECHGMKPDMNIVEVGGGGGKDFKALENFLELLVQLSFSFEDEKKLCTAFTLPSYDLKKMMQELLNLPVERNVSFEAKQFAQQLLTRFEPPKKEILQINQQTTARHIMLSYSWAANKQLVIAFGKKLKDLGYDIWRDEEGSTIMHPMSGDIIETMGEAVDKSCAVIIFVSPEYKESTNCRNEAGYARARAGNSHVKLFYVMMNENYHTRSSPRQVDGWLGFMIGSELWYPLWNESYVETAAAGIVGLIGNNARIATNALTVPPPSSPANHGKSSVVGSDFKYTVISSKVALDLVTAITSLKLSENAIWNLLLLV